MWSQSLTSKSFIPTWQKQTAQKMNKNKIFDFSLFISDFYLWRSNIFVVSTSLASQVAFQAVLDDSLWIKNSTRSPQGINHPFQWADEERHRFYCLRWARSKGIWANPLTRCTSWPCLDCLFVLGIKGAGNGYK